MLANLTAEGRSAALSGASLRGATCRMLDEAAFAAATVRPDWARHTGTPLGGNRLDLPPYAVAFVTLDAA